MLQTWLSSEDPPAFSPISWWWPEQHCSAISADACHHTWSESGEGGLESGLNVLSALIAVSNFEQPDDFLSSKLFMTLKKFNIYQAKVCVCVCVYVCVCVSVSVCPSQAIPWKLLKSSPSNIAR